MKKLISKHQAGKVMGIAPYAGYPEDKNRTLAWDDEENKLFSSEENSKYLNSKGIKHSVSPQGYYTGDNGQYLPQMIYYNDGKNDSHYSIKPNSISFRKRNGVSEHRGNFDFKNLSQEDYTFIKDSLGLDPTKFYSSPKEAEYYRPNSKLQLVPKRKVGNSTVTYDNNRYSTGNLNQAKVDEFTKYSGGQDDGYGSWHVVDPDKGYDFYVKQKVYRDGGSRDLQFEGKYPESLKPGRIKVAGMIVSDSDRQAATNYRNGVNSALKEYGIQFSE